MRIFRRKRGFIFDQIYNYQILVQWIFFEGKWSIIHWIKLFLQLYFTEKKKLFHILLPKSKILHLVNVHLWPKLLSRSFFIGTNWIICFLWMHLGQCTFDKISYLTNIKIPPFVNLMQKKTFSGCSSLSEILFYSPSSVFSKGICAFYGCSSLNKIPVLP